MGTAHCKLYLIWRERRWLVAHTHMQVLGKLRQIQDTCHNILESLLQVKKLKRFAFQKKQKKLVCKNCPISNFPQKPEANLIWANLRWNILGCTFRNDGIFLNLATFIEAIFVAIDRRKNALRLIDLQ